MAVYRAIYRVPVPGPRYPLSEVPRRPQDPGYRAVRLYLTHIGPYMAIFDPYRAI